MKPRFPHLSPQQIPRVSEIFSAVSDLYPYILSRYVSREAELQKKNLASSLFAFLSLRRLAIDRNKRNPFKTVPCNSLYNERAVSRILFYRGSCADGRGTSQNKTCLFSQLFHVKKPVWT